MTKILTASEIRRNERDRKIRDYELKYKDKFGTKIELYLYIAHRVGCSHITVYRVLRGAAK